jgi:membrane peptidoglycan carboxypeptidase
MDSAIRPGAEGMSTRTAPGECAPATIGIGCPYCGGGYLGGLGWSPPRQRPWWRRLLRRARRLLAIVAAVGVMAGLMFAGLMMVTPSVAGAPSQAAALARARRAPYPGPPVPPRFAAALVATEDHRFYAEPGIDPFGIARVIFGGLTGQPDQGGAALYQQLARMLGTPGGRGPIAGAEQITAGIKLALSYPKAEILQMYADVVYFGRGYYGLQEASCGYFGVRPAALSWAQAAMLAGLVPAPSIYNPIAHFSLARAREQHVLGRLVATGKLTEVQAGLAYREPLHIINGLGARSRCVAP